jgi:hypothetical protein
VQHLRRDIPLEEQRRRLRGGVADMLVIIGHVVSDCRPPVASRPSFLYKAFAQTFAVRYSGGRMVKELKTDTLNLRIAPGTKMALKGVAERENRSMANALEYLVVDYYKRHDIELPNATKQGGRDARSAKSK